MYTIIQFNWFNTYSDSIWLQQFLEVSMILEVAMLQAIEVRGPRRYAALDGAWASGYSAGPTFQSPPVFGRSRRSSTRSRDIQGYSWISRKRCCNFPVSARGSCKLVTPCHNHDGLTVQSAGQDGQENFLRNRIRTSVEIAEQCVQWIHWTHRDPREARVPQNGPLMAVVKCCQDLFPPVSPHFDFQLGHRTNPGPCLICVFVRKDSPFQAGGRFKWQGDEVQLWSVYHQYCATICHNLNQTLFICCPLHTGNL